MGGGTARGAAILAAAAKLVKAGGRLIYATCSLLTEENEGIVEAFLAQRADFRLCDATEILAHHKIAIDSGAYLRLLPHKHGTDGFFGAVLERRATG